MEIGIDIGGSKIAGGIVHHGNVLRRIAVPTATTRAALLAQLRDIIGRLMTPKVRSVGIGVPGTHKGTRVLSCPNLPALDGVDLRSALKLRVPLTVKNDAKCFGLAEYHYGAAKKKKNMLGVIFGTGVGGVIIIDGKLYTGAGNAGELGHQLLNIMLPKATEGKGDWEELLSGPGMVLRHHARGGKETTPASIWRAKNKVAQATRDETLRLVAIFIANSCYILEPDVIVFGGGLSNLPLARGVNKLLPNYGVKPIVRTGTLGVDAGILGAAHTM